MDLIRVENGNPVLEDSISARLVAFEKKAKQIKEQQDRLKQMILEAMEEHGILKIENEDLVLTYIATTDRETFDSKGFRKDHPDLFDEYVKMSPVKPSIRIRVK